MKSWYLYAALAAVIILVIGIAYHARSSVQSTDGNTQMPTIMVKGHTVRVYIADTDEERRRGLSGFTGLESDQGMLFVFPADGLHGFWMKDMLFSIDMVWIAADGTVVHIEDNVTPNTYPTTFKPDQPARYVLELPAATASAFGLQIGDRIDL